MQIVALLRGVTPTGKNRIPKMSYLAEILEGVGFKHVKTYIQSGNIVLDTDFPLSETTAKIHDTILEKIGADLSVIIKTKKALKTALTGNPFNDKFDYSRIHLVFTNDFIDKSKLGKIRETEFFVEIFHDGKECFYLYLPKDAVRKKLNTNFLEKQLGIIGTMRKLNVIQKLHDMME